MAGIKISALPAIPSSQLTDIFPAVQSGTTYQTTLLQVATLFGFSSGILAPANGGTGIANTGTITVGGNFAMSGAFTFTGTITGNTAVTFPTSGTLATTSQLPTLPLSMVNGGTGANLTAANGAIPYSGASVMALLAPGTTGQLFQSGGAGAPNWTTATYPSTAAISTLLYASASNVISSLAAQASSVLCSAAAGSNNIPTWIGPLTNGQLVMGSTGALPVAANITAGSGISVSNSAGGITISANGSAPIGWTDVTGTSQAMVADGGYVADNAGLVTLTLPTTAAFGTSINVVGKGSGGWTIAQNASQSIQIGSSVSTVGVSGSVSSTNQWDSVCLICVTANTKWVAFGGPQSSGLTIV